MKKIVFCIPGQQFSNRFLSCWSELMLWCFKKGIDVKLSLNYLPNVYHVRNSCLGGDFTTGVNQKPFQGQIDYDYTMWIDSDIVFKPEDLQRLIEADKDVISGLYLMSNTTQYATVETIDMSTIQLGQHNFMTREDLSDREEPFKVDYTGFGWILIKRGVFEKLEYPWFSPVWTSYTKNGIQVSDFSSEDAGFCSKAKKAGIDIYTHPKVIVGHEKSFVI